MNECVKIKLKNKIVKLAKKYIDNIILYKKQLNRITQEKNIEKEAKVFLIKNIHKDIELNKKILTDLNKNLPKNIFFLYTNKNFNVEDTNDIINFEINYGLFNKNKSYSITYNFQNLKFKFNKIQDFPYLILHYNTLKLEKKIIKPLEKMAKNNTKIEFIYGNKNNEIISLNPKILLLIYYAEKYVNKKISHLIYQNIKKAFEININFEMYQNITKNKKLFLLYLLKEINKSRNVMEDEKNIKFAKYLNVYFLFKDNIILPKTEEKFFKNIIFDFINLSFN